MRERVGEKQTETKTHRDREVYRMRAWVFCVTITTKFPDVFLTTRHRGHFHLTVTRCLL